MIRWALAGLLLLLAGAAHAACPPLPYNLTNGTVADANQVMANFNSVNSCAGSVGGFQQVSTNAQLTALSGMPAGLVVYRAGYYASGDGGFGWYTFSSLNCPAPDGGSQIAPNGGVGCWKLNLQPLYDVRQWGVVTGGTDPNGNNGTLINAAIAFAALQNNSSTVPGNPGLVPVLGGGVSIGVCSPVDITTGGIELGFMQLSISSTTCLTNFSLGTVSAGAITGQMAILENNAGGRTSIEHIAIEQAINGVNQPVNGYLQGPGGFNTVHDLTDYHWGQGTTAYAVTGSAGSGQYVITTADTSQIATGMVSRGNSGIPDQAIITRIISNTSFAISQGTTATLTSENLNFYLDGSGIIASGGARYSNMNILQYTSSDPDVFNEAKRAGYGFWATAGTQLNSHITQSQVQFGVSPFFMDAGSSGLNLGEGVAVQNGTGSPNTPSCTPGSEVACNPPCAVIAAGASGFRWRGGEQRECSVQYFDWDSTPIVLSYNDVQVVYGASAAILQPLNWLQVFTNQASTSLCRLLLGTQVENLAGSTPNEVALSDGSADSFAASGASWAATGGGQITFTTSANPGIPVNAQFVTAGFTPSGYNGTWTAISGTSGTTIVAASSNPGAESVLGTVTPVPSYFGLTAENITAINAKNNGVVFPGCGPMIPINGVNIDHPLILNEAPTIASGFGTGATIEADNGTASFSIDVGTSSGSSGVINLSPATNGWSCPITNTSTHAAGGSLLVTMMTAQTTTSATFTQFNNAGTAVNWADNDHLRGACFAR